MIFYVCLRQTACSCRWSTQLIKITGTDNSIVSCGAGANCTGVTGYKMPPTSSHPTLIDSVGPSAAVKIASNTSATRAKGTVLLTASRHTYMYWAFMLSGGAAVYNLDWAYTAGGHETGTNTDPQAATTSSGPLYQWVYQPPRHNLITGAY